MVRFAPLILQKKSITPILSRSRRCFFPRGDQASERKCNFSIAMRTRSVDHPLAIQLRLALVEKGTTPTNVKSTGSDLTNRAVSFFRVFRRRGGNFLSILNFPVSLRHGHRDQSDDGRCEYVFLPPTTASVELCRYFLVYKRQIS